MNDLITKLHLGALIFPMFYYIFLFIVLFSVLFAQKKKLISLSVFLILNIISCFTFLFFVYMCGDNATKEELLASYKSGKYSKARMKDILSAYAKIEKIRANKTNSQCKR